jgi:hypothetical protein
VNNIQTNFGGSLTIGAGLSPTRRALQRHRANGEIFFHLGLAVHKSPGAIEIATGVFVMGCGEQKIIRCEVPQIRDVVLTRLYTNFGAMSEFRYRHDVRPRRNQYHFGSFG